VRGGRNRRIKDNGHKEKEGLALKKIINAPRVRGKSPQWKMKKGRGKRRVKCREQKVERMSKTKGGRSETW